MKKIAILASGQGSNAENIFRFFANGNRVKVELVIYDRRDAPVAERMRALGADTLYLPSEVWTSRPGEIVELLRQREIDLVVLAGFLRLVPLELTSAFEGRILNIHPSLLPAYGGAGMYGSRVHEAVIAAGEKRSGATVHLVDDTIDGGRIILQEEVEVLPDDTPETLSARVREAEFRLYPRAIVNLLHSLDSSDNANSGNSAEAGQTEGGPETPPAQNSAASSPGEAWAEALGMRFDPTKLPPAYPGAVPPPVSRGVPASEVPPISPASPVAGNAVSRTPVNVGEKMPSSYLVWSVIATVLCCLPAGIVAIIFSSQVSSRYYAGDIDGARRASDRAQIWIIVSFVLGVLVNTLYLPVALLFN